MPVFRTKKEAFQWLSNGQKKIDVRKGNPRRGELAVFVCGRSVLKLKILKKESGPLREIMRLENFKLIVPSACDVDGALSYLWRLYDGYDGIFTAYYVAVLET